MTNWKKEVLNIPIKHAICESGIHVVATTDESKKILGQYIIAQGQTFEEANKEFFISLKFTIDYHKKRSMELDKWKPFQKGPWKRDGGKWFSVFGINVYFRYGENMKYGFYIPFTKLNMKVTNRWRKKLNKTK